MTTQPVQEESPDFDGRSDYGSGASPGCGLWAWDQRTSQFSESPNSLATSNTTRRGCLVRSDALPGPQPVLLCTEQDRRQPQAVGLNGLTKKEITPVKDMDKKFDDVKGCKEAKEELSKSSSF